MTDKDDPKNAKQWCLREGNKYLDQLDGFSKRCREGLLNFENEAVQNSCFISAQIMCIFMKGNLADMVNEVVLEMQREIDENLKSTSSLILPGGVH